MISDWISNDSLTRIDQVLNVIYDLRICTKNQLIAITGLGKHNIDSIIKNIRKLPVNTRGEGKEEWLQIRGLNLPKKPGDPKVVYSLGKTAIRHVRTLRGLESRSREAPSSQMGHFVGINDILVRSIEKYGHDRVQWFSEMELATLLFLQIKEVMDIEPKASAILRPDAQLIIDGQPYFIEFDNATEGPRQLEGKFSRYIELYEILDYSMIPVLWVANTQKRLNYIQKNWEITVSRVYAGYDTAKIPKFLFAVAGEEHEITGVKKRVIKTTERRVPSF